MKFLLTVFLMMQCKAYDNAGFVLLLTNASIRTFLF